MPQFKYKAKDRNGNTVEDVVEASDQRAAASVLREHGLYPMEIFLANSPSNRAAGASNNIKASRSPLDAFYTGVNIRSLAMSFTQISTMLKAGMSIHEVLHSQAQHTKGRLGGIMHGAAVSVQSGERFSATLEKYPAIFNSLVVSLVKAGESSGMMDVMAARIAQNLEFEINTRRSFSKVMLYPYIILFFIILTPHIPALVMSGGAAFWASLWSSLRYWLPGLVAAFVAIKILMQYESARMMWDSIKIVPPVIGTAAAKVALSRFSRALSSLYSSGMPMHEALRISADASGNLSIAAKLKPAIAAISSGKGFTQSVAMTGALPPLVIDMLTVGEKTGNYQAVLEKAADHMESEAETSFTKASVILFVLCILAAGLVVGSMVLRFYVGAATGIMNGVEL